MINEGLTYEGSDISDHEVFEKLHAEHQRLLLGTNGFILFDGGLHVRGAVEIPDWHSLAHVWSGDFALYKLFPALDESDVPFGQDCLGDQFVLRQNVVHKLDAELGQLESLDMSLEVFLAHARKNPVEFLSLQPLLQFFDDGGVLKPGQLLSVYPPFVTKESENGVSLEAVSMFDRIRFLADFARQVSGLGEGTKIDLTVDE
ncbi:MAG TPA: hypothetical protein VGX24_03135 [Pyrinomonadaceae bacterium]|jgi:hypothetical protein|nr:hypothetical protein [Pyrinomonadaceae bacterium]